MAERDQVLGRGPRAADVVDLDRAVLRQRGRVDQDDRQPGAADLLDLGMVVGQADGDHPVDRRPAHRPRQRAVERRDEVEAVAGFLGGAGDALAEGAEERVGEDHRQGLRGQHADRQGLAAGSASGRPGAACSRAAPRRRGSATAVSGASRSGLLNANETAVLDTPASRATSAMRGRIVRCSTRVRLPARMDRPRPAAASTRPGWTPSPSDGAEAPPARCKPV